jgi:hypothetical protein
MSGPSGPSKRWRGRLKFPSPKDLNLTPIHADATAEMLGLFRIVVFGLWFAKFLALAPHRIAVLPSTLFDAPGILALLPETVLESLHSRAGLVALKWAGLVSTAAAAIGLRPFTLVGAVAALAIVLIHGTVNGFGAYLHHTEFVLMYCAMILALFPACADKLSIVGAKRRQEDNAAFAVPLFLCTAVLLATYSFVGTARVAGGGVDILQDESLRTWFVVRAMESAEYSHQYGVLLTDSLWLYRAMQLGFAVVTLFEFLSPLALFHKGFRVIWLAVVVPFHVMSLFTMNIFFWENLIIALMLLTPLTSTLVRCLGRFSRR